MPASYALPVSISHKHSEQLMHVNFRETQITCHTKTNAGVLLPTASTQQLPQPPVTKKVI